MHVVYSTATSDIDYVAYHPGAPTDASSKIKRRIRIRGGANVAPAKGQLITPKGVATIVNDEEMAFLEANDAFKRHQARGFMYVEKGSKPKDADAIARNMTPKDMSAPMTKDSIPALCGEDTKTIVPIVEPTESSKARMK